MKKLLLSLAAAASVATIAIAAGSMAKAPATPGTTVEYVRAKSIVSGQKYAIYALEGVAEPIASRTSSVNTVEVKSVDNTFEYGSNYAFTLTAVEGQTVEYYIQDYSGLYLGVESGNRNYFTVSETSSDADVWIIEFDASGNATVTNKKSNLGMYYDQRAYSFILATEKASDQMFPWLYRLMPVEQVADIKAFKALDDQAKAQINGATTAVYQSGDELWIQDATGALYVNGDVKQTYKTGDVIPAGISGRLTINNGLYELTSPAAFAASTATAAVEPTELTPATVTIANQSQLVALKGVKIAGSGSSYVASAGGASIALVNHFGKEIKAAEEADIVGLVGISNGQPVVYPTEVTVKTEAKPTVVGAGTLSDPYSVADVLLIDPTDGGNYADKWVKGYIVGYVPTGLGQNTWANATNNLSDPKAVAVSNVIIGPTPTCSDFSLCIPVELPEGKIRNAVNLSENPGNLGKELQICGTIGQSFKVNGVKAPTNYHLEGEATYSLDLLVNDAKDWSYENNNLAGASNKVWYWNSTLRTLIGSGYDTDSSTPLEVNGAYAVSPIIVLSDAKEAYVSFRHAAAFQTTIKDLCGFYIRDYDGNRTWTKLEIPNWPVATNDLNNWVYASSGMSDLRAWLGKRVQVAFKYSSSLDGADIWRVKDLSFTGDESIKALSTQSSSKTVYSVAEFNDIARQSTLSPLPTVTVDCELYTVYSNNTPDGDSYTWLTDKKNYMLVHGHFSALDSDVPNQYYQNGYKLKKPIIGSAFNYSDGQVEMTDPERFGSFELTEHLKSLIQPTEITLKNIRASLVNEYILLHNVAVVEKAAGEFEATSKDEEGNEYSMPVVRKFITSAANRQDTIRLSTGSGLDLTGFVMVENGAPYIVLTKSPDQYRVKVVETPQFSVPGGAVFSGRQVVITCKTEGATIRYSIDGGEFTDYDGKPIVITKETEITAYAVKDGYQDSGYTMAQYTIAERPYPKDMPSAEFIFERPDSLLPVVTDFVDHGNERFAWAYNRYYMNDIVVEINNPTQANRARIYDENGRYFLRMYPNTTFEVLTNTNNIMIVSVEFISDTPQQLDECTVTPAGYSSQLWEAAYGVAAHRVLVTNSSRTNQIDLSRVTVYYTDVPTTADPVLSLKSGEVTPGTAITITCKDKGATIYYYLNDESEARVYSSPIEITENTSIRAYAQVGDYKQSNEVSAIYTVTSGITDLGADESEAEAEYYTLQGVRVENPESGLYIRRQGNSVTKVYIK